MIDFDDVVAVRTRRRLGVYTIKESQKDWILADLAHRYLAWHDAPKGSPAYETMRNCIVDGNGMIVKMFLSENEYMMVLGDWAQFPNWAQLSLAVQRHLLGRVVMAIPDPGLEDSEEFSLLEILNQASYLQSVDEVLAA